MSLVDYSWINSSPRSKHLVLLPMSRFNLSLTDSFTWYKPYYHLGGVMKHPLETSFRWKGVSNSKFISSHSFLETVSRSTFQESLLEDVSKYELSDVEGIPTSRMPLKGISFVSFSLTERTAWEGAGAAAPRVRGEGARMGNRKQRPQERGGQASRRDGGYPKGAAGPNGHQAGSRAGDCCIQEAVGGWREQVWYSLKPTEKRSWNEWIKQVDLFSDYSIKEEYKNSHKIITEKLNVIEYIYSSIQICSMQ